METIHVHGGVSLQGNVRIQGSKNAALPILAATILTEGKSLLGNCPRISDVCQMIRILNSLGCRACRERDGILVESRQMFLSEIPAEAVTGMRSSVFLMGALLGSRGEVLMEHPGGCVIGERPIDYHLDALRRMGAVFEEHNGKIRGTAPHGLHGARICLPGSSVGATENVILAGVRAEGDTVIENAATEPEVESLCRYLICCGARISGAGSRCIRITGKEKLSGCSFRIPADRIVAGTYLFACLGTGGNVLLEDAPVYHMENVMRVCECLGAQFQVLSDALYVHAPPDTAQLNYLVTEPYPGFPTDLQSAALAVLSGTQKDCLVEETIFENRFRIADPLRQMGARLYEVDRRRILVKKTEGLKGAAVKAAELRGGAALVIAGLMAEGETVIEGCSYIERGYENICRDLRELGARIYCV